MLTRPSYLANYVGAFTTKRLGHSYEADGIRVYGHVRQIDLSNQWIVVVERSNCGGSGYTDVVRVLSKFGFFWIKSDFLNLRELELHFPV